MISYKNISRRINSIYWQKIISLLVTFVLLFSILPSPAIVLAEGVSSMGEGQLPGNEEIANEEQKNDQVKNSQEEILVEIEGENIQSSENINDLDVSEPKETINSESSTKNIETPIEMEAKGNEEESNLNSENNLETNDPREGKENNKISTEEEVSTNNEPEIINEVDTNNANQKNVNSSGNSSEEQTEISPESETAEVANTSSTLETVSEDEIELSEKENKQFKRIQQIQLKLKNKNINNKKKKKLMQKLEKIKQKQENKKIKKLIKEHKKQRKALRKKFKEHLKNKDLIKEGREALRVEFKQQLQSLRSINDDLKDDLEETLRVELDDEEKEEIEYIEPNYLFELQNIEENTEPISFTPNDPQFGSQWGLNWITNGQLSEEEGGKMVVAMIDTGVDYNHEDLQGQLWTSETCVDDTSEVIEGGCMKGGYDFVDHDNDPFPIDGYDHGTAVSGIIGANTSNGIGIASIGNNGVEIMALRSCCTTEGFFEVESIIEAIYFAINNGAQVINMSFGGPTYSEKLKEAIEYARQNNVLVVAAAGNYGTNNDIDPIYPASFDLDNIMSVGALNQDSELAYFSNYGQYSVDIVAPGTEVLSTISGNNYSAVSGTSFSAPFVSATLAQYINLLTNTWNAVNKWIPFN